jgi:hypothetical protein
MRDDVRLIAFYLPHMPEPHSMLTVWREECEHAGLAAPYQQYGRQFIEATRGAMGQPAI